MNQASDNFREPGMPEWMSADLVEACMRKLEEITGSAPGGEVWVEWECDPKAYYGYTSYYRNLRTLQTRWDRPLADGNATIVLSNAMTKQIIETMERQEEKAARQEQKQTLQRIQEAYNKPGVLDWGEEVGEPFVVKDIKGTQWWMVWTDTGKIFYADKTTKATTWTRPPELEEHSDVKKWLAVPWQEVVDEERCKRDRQEVGKNRRHRDKKEKRRDSETHRQHSPNRRRDEKRDRRKKEAVEEARRPHSPSRRRDEKRDKREKEAVEEGRRYHSPSRRRDEKGDKRDKRRHGKAHH